MKEECIICRREFHLADLFCLATMRRADIDCIVNNCPLVCEKCMNELKRNLIKISDKKSAIPLILDFLYEIDEDAVKEWIYNRWPHGVGLYD